MKKVQSILILQSFALLLFFACKQPNNKPPVADTETESSIDAAWATFIITDVEQQCAFLGENNLSYNFYTEIPGSKNNTNGSGTVQAISQPTDQFISYAFNNSSCYDGKIRSGTLQMFYKHDTKFDKYVKEPNANARYFHDNGYVGRFSLLDYDVNGWRLEIDASKHGLDRGIIANIMPAGYQAAIEPIKWQIIGDFKLTNLSNPNQKIEFSVNLTKSLLNANNPLIYNQYQTGATINWTDFQPFVPNSTITPNVANTAALIAYSGTVAGTSSNGEKFRMIIDPSHPLIRDFKCYSDKISSITANVKQDMVPVYNEFHPFVQGAVSLTTACSNTPDIDVAAESKVYPRQIFFGNEDVPGLDMQCDNSGTILIKGIGYKIDFRK